VCVGGGSCKLTVLFTPKHQCCPGTEIYLSVLYAYARVAECVCVCVCVCVRARARVHVQISKGGRPNAQQMFCQPVCRKGGDFLSFLVCAN